MKNDTIEKEETMKNLSTQAVILMSVIAICASGIAIALITDDDCRQGHEMFGRPPPPPGMHGGFENRGDQNRGRGGMRRQRQGGQRGGRQNGGMNQGRRRGPQSEGGRLSNRQRGERRPPPRGDPDDEGGNPL